MDLDLRPGEWAKPEAFGRAVREVLGGLDVLIGTEEEFYAALMPEPQNVWNGGTVPNDEHPALDAAVEGLLDGGPSCIVVKRGARGATCLTSEGRADVPGFEVDVVNTVGAGDAFAAGLIRSRLLGAGFREAIRYGNACGAIVVTRHGCSLAFPREDEVHSFLESRGGR